MVLPRGPAMFVRLANFDQKRTELKPGTVLVREWDRQSQRVMMMADGFPGMAGRMIASPKSPTRSPAPNGPRFFGLRDGPNLDYNWIPPEQSAQITKAILLDLDASGYRVVKKA
jgi:hypothetical protein